MLERTRFTLSLAAVTVLGLAPAEGRAEGDGPGATATDPATAPASAEPDVAEARDAFRLGSSLAKQGQWADALAAFQRSARLKAHPATAYNIAYSERALGRYVHAALHFREALAKPEWPDAPSLSPELAVEAATYLAEADQRLVRATVRTGPADLTLRVDGKSIEPAPGMPGQSPHMIAEDEGHLGVPAPREFELWLDPGAHVFVASDARGGQIVVNRSLAAGETTALDFTPAAAPAVPPAKTAPPRAGVDLALPPPPRDHTAAYVALGAGAAGLVASGLFAGLALADKAAIEDDSACANRRCPDLARYRDRQDRMLRFADFATVGFVVGLVGAGVGTTLLLWPAPGTSGSGRATAVTGTPSGVRFRF